MFEGLIMLKEHFECFPELLDTLFLKKKPYRIFKEMFAITPK